MRKFKLLNIKLWLGIAAVLLCLPLLACILLLYAANTENGRVFISNTASSLTANKLTLTGLTGHLPEHIMLDKLVWQDDKVLVSLDKLRLDWQPWRLLEGEANIQQLQLEQLSYQPAPNPPASKPSEPFTLPVAIDLQKIHIGALDLSALTGQATILSLDGHARLTALDSGSAVLTLKQAQSDNAYRLDGTFDKSAIHAKIAVQEPTPGLLTLLAGLKDSKPLALNADIDGPMSALQTHSHLTWGELSGDLSGVFDAEKMQADWQISATAPAMQAHAKLAWQSLALQGTVKGELSKPTIHSTVEINNLKSDTTGIGHVYLSVQGNMGQLQLNGDISQLTLANSPNDVLQASPLKLDVAVRLDEAQRPLTLKLKHPLLTATGNAILSPLDSQLQLTLPNLKALSALGGLDVAGNSTLTLKLKQNGRTTAIAADGQVAITGGDPLLTQLLGPDTRLNLAANNSGEDILVSAFQIKGKSASLQADGSLKGQNAQFNWQMTLADLSILAEKSKGNLKASGQITGPLNDFTALAEITGEVGTATVPRQPVTAKLKAEHLPNQPIGQLTANSVLAGAPLELAFNVKPQADQALLFSIARADWKSLHSEGAMTLAKGSTWPVGEMRLNVKRLEVFKDLSGLNLSGNLNASIKTAGQGKEASAAILLNARKASLIGTAAFDQAKLTLSVRDPLNRPDLKGRLIWEGMTAGELKGAGQLGFSGLLEQLGLELSATVDNLAGQPLKVTSHGQFFQAKQELAIKDLTALWQEQNLRLLAPTSLAFADGLAVRHLRLGLEKAMLEADGQISPQMNLTANLKQFDLASLKILLPDLQATGMVSADAKLRGTPAKAIGTVNITGSDIRFAGYDKSLPSMQVSATAELDGATAKLQSKLNAGDNAKLDLSGLVPLNPSGILDLQTAGTIELKLLDPLLTADGRRVRGKITLSGGVNGTLAEPKASGTATLSKVEFRDYAIGLNLTGIDGTMTAKDGVVTLNKLQAHAGKGTIDVKGTLEPFKNGLPLDLIITARDAKPLASDRLTVNLNADLTLRGTQDNLLLLGNININRADIRIPEHLPANIAVLKLENVDNSETTPAKSDSKIKLKLAISASDEVFVRGRGIDAELGGTVQVQGTLNNPRPDGGFKLRRGQFTLAGKTLTFTQGKVGFESGVLTDPSLDFTANSSSDSVTATLKVGGTAYKPKITLSSVPDLPQDEVLARLLFNRSAASLSVFEIVQIASALATLTGASSDIDPLNSIRQTLGLDRLTIGGKNTSIEAGSYVLPGVYLGTRQGLSGGPQAMIQLDVTKSIKLEAAVGANSPNNKNVNPNSLGIIYQFEY